MCIRDREYPDHLMKWIIKKFGGITNEESYKLKIDEFRRNYLVFASKHSVIHKLLKLIINFSIQVNDIQRKINPYLFAIITLVIGLIIYINFLKYYATQ